MVYCQKIFLAGLNNPTHLNPLQLFILRNSDIDMSRLNIDRQNKLEPIRLQKAIMEITNLGLKITSITQKMIEFEFKGHTVRFYPYSGWATGKTIKDGRGLNNLIKQLKQ